MTPFFNAAEAGRSAGKDWVRVAHQAKDHVLQRCAAEVPPSFSPPPKPLELHGYGLDRCPFRWTGISWTTVQGLLLAKKDFIDAAQLTIPRSSNTQSVGGWKWGGGILVCVAPWTGSAQGRCGNGRGRSQGAALSQSACKTVPRSKQASSSSRGEPVPHYADTYDRNRIK